MVKHPPQTEIQATNTLKLDISYFALLKVSKCSFSGELRVLADRVFDVDVSNFNSGLTKRSVEREV